MIETNILTTQLKELIDYFGLKSFDVEIFANTDSDGQSIHLTRNFSDVKALLDGLTTDIQQSELIADRTTEYRNLNAALKTQLDALQLEVEELKRYKHHFDLQYKLTRG